MPEEGLDEAAYSFSNEVAPKSEPRDSRGGVVQTSSSPELMFEERRLEGDPSTGDTDDGGDDTRLRAREREIADGHDQREGRESTQNRQNLRRAADDEVDDDADAEESDAVVEGEPVSDADEGPRYEVQVDGQTQEVSLQEALRGYVRQATFHQRMTQLNKVQGEIEQEVTRLQQHGEWLNKASRDYEEDVAHMLPQEPNWDQAFASDPHGAHIQQKIFQSIYENLARSRQNRANREAWELQENNRRVQKYAIDGFSKFVMDNIKLLPDEPTLHKNLRSMRRTASGAGFTDYEVATVYDPRMLTVLLKASKYDRMTANRPQAVVSDRGRTLTPGAATPLGNAPRKGIDDAQRRLAQSGKIQDAVDVFRRIL